jgi:hypothetical protein
MSSEYVVKNWVDVGVESREHIAEIEKKVWAPWLAAGVESIEGRNEIFPKGQLTVIDGSNIPVASLSTNRVNIDISNLPSWDDVAGEPTTYENTYISSGDTLVLMSMNVDPHHQGKGHPAKLIKAAKELANDSEVKQLLGSFRPSGYGEACIQEGVVLPFWEYCQSVRDDGMPVDPWLRNLKRNGGISIISEDPSAMEVEVSLEDFAYFKESYKPEKWVELELGKIACGETGFWQIHDDKAVYRESNVWGIIPL